MYQSNHHLQATLQALGYLEDGKYYKSRDCLNAAKDIVRFLRHDDENMKSTRIELLESGVLTNDLIPLMKTLEPKKDDQLFDIVLRLSVNLTQSAITCFDRKIPTDKIESNVFLQIDNYLKKAKESFSDESFIKVLNKKLNEILNKDWKNRPEEEELIIERILFLIRNMLMIKAGTDDDGESLSTGINSHDMLICAFDKGGIFETLIKLSSSSHEPKYMIHLLEIITFILRERSAKELGLLKETTAHKRSQVEKDEDNDELLKLQLKDKHIRQYNRFNLNPRHSRFVGTYVATNVKSINDQNNQICHKPLPNINDLFDDSGKKYTRKPKHRVAVEEEDQQVRSIGTVKVILMKFCKNFLKNSYNSYMGYLNDMIQRKKLEDDEVSSYYWLIKFFMEFNRYTDELRLIKIDRMRQTFSLEMLHSIEVYITRCIEMLVVEKQDTIIWIKRMHTCINCYKEYLLTLKSLENKKLPSLENESNSEIRINNVFVESNDFDCLNVEATELVIKIKNQIFYIQEFRELFINVMKDFNESKTTKTFLKDVIEANHIFLEMLETCLNENNEISVQKKMKKSRRKSKTVSQKKVKKDKKPKESLEVELKNEIEEKFVLFEKIENDLVDLLNKNKDTLKEDNDDTDLFQLDFATSNTEIDAQKDKAIKKIQNYIKNKKLINAIVLYREAKYMWPNENDLFGDDTLTSTEELEKIKDLFMKHYDDEEDSGDGEVDDEVVQNDFDEEHGDYDNDEEQYAYKEEQLDFLKFFMRYTSARIIKSYIYVLGDYAKNTDFQNNCCLKFFERIVDQCNLPQYLYQLSLFNLIDKIYKDPLRKCLELNVIQSGGTIIEFFRKLLNKFFDELKTHPKLFLELLFLKDKKIVCEINEGYGTSSVSSSSIMKKKGGVWSNDDIDELKELYEKYKDVVHEAESETDQQVTQHQQGDVVDRIMLNMIDCNRKRKEICLQLVRIGLVSSIDELKEKSDVTLGRSRIWRSEDIEDLRNIFEKFKDTDIQFKLNNIKENLKVKRSKKDIIEKLLELDLIMSRHEVQSKKTRTKSESNKKKPFVAMDDDIIDAEDTDEDKSSIDSSSDEDEPLSENENEEPINLNKNADESPKIPAKKDINKSKTKSKSKSRMDVLLDDILSDQDETEEKPDGIEDNEDSNRITESPDESKNHKKRTKTKRHVQALDDDEDNDNISSKISSVKAQFKRRMYTLNDDENSNNSTTSKSSKNNNDNDSESPKEFDQEDKENFKGKLDDDADDDAEVTNRSKRQRLIIDSDSE